MCVVGKEWDVATEIDSASAEKRVWIRDEELDCVSGGDVPVSFILLDAGS